MPVETVRIGSATLIRGDCLAVMPELGPVDSIVCDPPYHLLSTVKRFGTPGAAAPTSAAHGRLARGFMGQQWDGGDIAFRAETWATIGAALKPGGFLLAFGGTRTWHRLACAIEDAGFVIQDTIAWIYGSGFPKNKTLLKPAFEPIVVAYKPGGKRELSIDECRIETKDGDAENAVTQGINTDRTSWAVADAPRKFEPSQAGRWPANLCHDGSDEVMELFPAKVGAVAPASGPTLRDGNTRVARGRFNGLSADRDPAFHGDSGSAARFFYCAKASKADRAGSRHPTVKPQALMRWLVQLVTPPGGTVLDPFGGSGSTAQAALAVGRKPILIERESQWFADARCRIEAAQAEAKAAA
jgi:site-specific DNA-methyltransferase (adenine-specific)